MHRNIAGTKYLAGSLLAVVLISCAPPADVTKYNLDPTPAALARGYLPILPISFFDMAAVTPVDSTNLIGRVANLRNKIRTLAGPVIPARDRARLEAAIARR